MKKISFILSALLCLSLTFTSCEALFDNLEGDLTKIRAALSCDNIFILLYPDECIRVRGPVYDECSRQPRW